MILNLDYAATDSEFIFDVRDNKTHETRRHSVAAFGLMDAILDMRLLLEDTETILSVEYDA